MVNYGSVRHVPAEDLPILILIRARNVRIRRFIIPFNTVRLSSAYYLLLLVNWKRLPRGCVVLPVLQQEEGAWMPLPVSVIKVVSIRIIIVDSKLDQSQPKQAGIEVNILLRISRNRRDMAKPKMPVIAA